MPGSHLGRGGTAALLLASLIALSAGPAAALPVSLRSESDLTDLVERVLDNVSAGDVKGSLRLAGRYRPMLPGELATWIGEVEERRRELRKKLGLSLGHEHLASEPAGERVLRISHLERFDKGAVVWRFVFYRADGSWQLVDVTDTTDLQTLFGGR